MPAKKPDDKNPSPPPVPASTNGQPATVAGGSPPFAAVANRPAGAGGHGHAGAHAEQHVEMDLPPVSRGALVVIAAVVVVLFGGLFVLGWTPHQKKLAEAREDADAAVSDKVRVDVLTPRPSAADPQLVLPANVEAMQATAVYARTNGYIREMLVDIGDPVKAGQPLARIAAPEVDAELQQAKASLEQAKVAVNRAGYEFKFNDESYARYKGLAETGGVTKQQLDERRSAYNIAISNRDAANATVAAAEASVKRYTELQSFQTVVAPFDGTVTARNYDVGALVSTTATGPGRELFRVDQTDTLRVFVNVPQAYVSSIENGQEAELLVNNLPGKPVKGKVARSAEALDPSTRTLRLEVHVPNADKKLFAGMFGQVRFKLKRDQQPLVVPTSALLFGADGLRVAVVDGENKVHFRHVTLGRDFGTEAEVVHGVTAEDRVVVNPGDRLIDGLAVQVAAAKPATGTEQGKPATTASTNPATGPATSPAAAPAAR